MQSSQYSGVRRVQTAKGASTQAGKGEIFGSKSVVNQEAEQLRENYKFYEPQEEEEMQIVDSDDDSEQQIARSETEWFEAFLKLINENGSAMRFKIYAIDMMKKELAEAVEQKKKREALG